MSGSGDRAKPKLEWRHSLESPETVMMKRQRKAMKEFQRSSTISSAHPSASPDASSHRVHRSPLERFRHAKSEIARAFVHIQNCLEQAQAFLRETVPRNGGGEKKIEPLVDRVKGIEEILDRVHMKVVFFGLNSSGKSTVINALLRNKILPMNFGHTTSCFCSVRGVSASEGYVLVPGSEEKKDLKVVQKLANALHKDRLSESSLLRVYWPQSKCALLQEDVELVDSPAVNLSHSLDECINQHCLDADVFVLVSKAEAPLSKAEASFFVHVSQRLSLPNIFILTNRWDRSVEQPEMAGHLKKQHLDSFVDFFSRDLKICKRDMTTKRVYFVSAKEVLLKRIREQNQVKDVCKGFDDGHRERLLEFEQFEEQLKESLSNSAIHTKFENHHQRGTDILGELDELLQEEECKILDRRESVCRDLEEAKRYKQRLESEGSSLKGRCKSKVSSTVDSVKKSFSQAICDVVRQLSDIADEYNGNFDLQHLESYKAGLFEHVDATLQQKLQEVCSSTLSSLHRQACADITGCYQRVLEVSLADAQWLSSQTSAPEITYVLSCADLCDDFREDLDFHFSLGLDRLQSWANSGSALLNVRKQLSQFLTIIPPDLFFPLSIAFGTLVLSRLLSWRYLLPSLGIYCGVYVYEKVSWTEKTQEQALKNQFVKHLERNFQLQLRAIRDSYVAALETSLGSLVSSLGNVFADTHRGQDLTIKQLRGEETQLTKFKNQARDLRNNVHHLQTHLETFRENYLNGVD